MKRGLGSIAAVTESKTPTLVHHHQDKQIAFIWKTKDENSKPVIAQCSILLYASMKTKVIIVHASFSMPGLCFSDGLECYFNSLLVIRFTSVSSVSFNSCI